MQEMQKWIGQKVAPWLVHARQSASCALHGAYGMGIRTVRWLGSLGIAWGEVSITASRGGAEVNGWGKAN